MIVFDLELPSCEHTRLKNDGHSLALYQTVLVVEIRRDFLIDEIIEMVYRIDCQDRRNRPDPLRIDGRGVEAIFCEGGRLFVGSTD